MAAALTLRGYHAIEVEADKTRKMQASSDYEPSRVLMLLEALLNPIPRNLSSPSLSDAHPKWKIEQAAVRDLSYIKISRAASLHDIVYAYVFCPKGSWFKALNPA